MLSRASLLSRGLCRWNLQDGYGRFKVTQANGRRVTAANSYLNVSTLLGRSRPPQHRDSTPYLTVAPPPCGPLVQRSVRSRKNLRIQTKAYVTRVVMEGTKAVGVEYQVGKERRVARINKDGEVRRRLARGRGRG